jgi:septum site-determining protein MinC
MKGRMLPVTRINATTDDLAAIQAQLESMARQMPAMVQGMTAVLETSVPVSLAGYLSAVRSSGMKVVGVSGALLEADAAGLGLPVLPADTGAAKPARGAAQTALVPQSAAPETVPAPAPAPAARTSSRLIADPIRGGQQIYARGADLTITHQVGAGAEVVADGNIHIYGRLAGRAIAGADGDTQARIFCRRFEPELVAIAGVYAVAEQLHGEWLGKPAQVFLQDGTLKVERLD